MYPRPFHYHRAKSLEEACSLLSQLGGEAKPIAGGQSLLPLMKLRLASPAHLVDLSFIPRASYIEAKGSTLRIGALTRHAEVESSAVAAQIPILHDCAAGIADVQVRNLGTMGGSLAEADPSGDWAPVLLTLNTTVHAVGPKGGRAIPLAEFITDAFTTVLGPADLVREVEIEVPAKASGGAYLAFKRAAPVYPTASVAVQMTLAHKETCQDVRIALGAVGLTAIRAQAAEATLRGKRVTARNIETAAEAARAAAQPQPDIRGSAEYKRDLVAALVKRAVQIALRRCGGEHVEVSHIYA